jgi:DNA-binding NarL/FixJ family response regulator
MPRIYKEHAVGLPFPRSRLRLVLADDHTILRQGLRAILDAEPDLEVIGEATNVQDAVALSLRLRPDIVITDVAFANGSGFQAVTELRRECVGVRVLMLTGHRCQECMRAAMTAGAHAYIVKDSPVEVLLRAIRAESSEFDHSAAPLCAAQEQRRSSERFAAAHMAEMTVRELQVLRGVALGYSSKRIAGDLGRSVRTVEKHRSTMMHKLGLHNAAAVTRFAIDNGLLDAKNDTARLRSENDSLFGRRMS